MPKPRILAALFLLVLLLAWLANSLLTPPDPRRALPDTIAAATHFKSPLKAMAMLDKDLPEPWRSLWRNSLGKYVTDDLKTLVQLSGSASVITQALLNESLYVGYTLQPSDSLYGLYLLRLSEDIRLDDCLKNNALQPAVFPYSFRGQTLYKLRIPGKGNLVLASQGKLLLCSRQTSLIEDALAQMENGGGWWSTTPAFGQLETHGMWQTVFKPSAVDWAAPEFWKETPKLIADHIQWLGVAWENTRPPVCLVGASGGFLSLARWTHEKHHNLNALQTVIPADLAVGVSMSVSRWSSFFSAAGRDDDEDFQDFIKPWLGSEYFWGITAPRSDKLLSEQLLLVQPSDSAKMLEKMNELAEKTGLVKHYEHQTFEIMQYAQGNWLTPLAGSPLMAFRQPVVANVGGIVVMAPTPAAMETLIDQYVVSQTLSSNTDFLQLMQREGSDAGFATALINMQHLPALLQATLGVSRQKWMDDAVATGLLSVRALEHQSGQFRLEINAQQVANTAQQSAADMLWQTPLNAECISRPVIIEMGNTKTVMVQDATFQLYCLDENGQIRWKRQLDGPLLSEVKGLDLMHDGEPWFVANTARSIWAISSEGVNFNQFPFKLPSPAASGMLIVDFDNSLKYNYFLGGKDGKVYGFDRYAVPLSGWNPVALTGENHVLNSPITHFQSGGKDYLGALTKGGFLHVFDRFGHLRFQPVLMSTEPLGALQVDRNPVNPRFAAMSQRGKGVVCNLQGKTFPLSLYGEQALLTQLSGDAKAEWVTVKSHQRVSVWSYPGGQLEVVANAPFQATVDTVFSLDAGKFGMLDRSRRKIFGFNAQCRSLSGFPLGGSTAFTTGVLQKQKAICTGLAASVCAYRMR